MDTDQIIHVIGCHAEGEVGDVIVGGVEPPPGDTVLEQSQWIAKDQTLRRFLLNEPRGGVFRHVNLLVPPTDPAAHIGFIIMEPEHTPLMSGSNSICVATVVLETGIVPLPLTESETRLVLEAPGGLVEALAECRDDRVERVTITNVPSFAAELDVPLQIEGIGEVRVDIAFGGDSFVMVDAADLGVAIEPEAARVLAELGARITRAANDQIGFAHPTLDWSHISFCQIAGPLQRGLDGTLTMQNTVVIDPGKLDRSPTGTGLSARMAVLRARGEMQVGAELVMRSVIGSQFTGRIVADTTVGAQPAIIPTVSGRAWLTGSHQYMLDPRDPWPGGYRLTDTWPAMAEGSARA